MLLAVVTQGLLRFRAVAVLGAANAVEVRLRQSYPLRTWRDVIGPVIVSGQVGYHHFGTVIVHAGLLWLACAIGNLLFVIVPQALLRSWLIPTAPGMGAGSWLVPTSALALTFSTTALNALVAGLNCVYDARLYIALGASGDESR
jgi:hypothetical protein